MRGVRVTGSRWPAIVYVTFLSLGLGLVMATGVHAASGQESRRPNILLWMLDDAGFAHLGAYGGLIETPVLNDLAGSGLRYSNFHATGICSASRAALLTGRNHHAVNMGMVTETNIDAPGYSGRIPKSSASLAKLLRNNGYTTFALGKWHQTPGSHVSSAGPFDYWPSGQGFDHFYGFIGGDADQFSPQLYAGHTPVHPGEGRTDYDLTEDLADKAIYYLTSSKAAAPDKPLFIYFATGAVHAPHSAPRSWLDKYRGKFDMGWDVARERILERQKSLGLAPDDIELPPRPDAIPAWESLNPDEKRVATRAMEAFAAQLDHADHQFGRILDKLRQMGELENTIVIVTSDNGASAEGGPNGNYNEVRMMNGLTASLEQNLAYLDAWGGPGAYNHYNVGWAMAGNTPFKYYKQTVHFGGIRVPLIISWPERISGENGIRGQFHHLNDIMPTLLEAVGVSQPEQVDGVRQEPFDGVSMLYSFAGDGSSRKHVQYFHMTGNSAIWEDGWKAVLMHRPEPWDTYGQRDYSQDRWELYHTDQDFNEIHDLAREQPQRLAALQKLYEREAQKNQVTPIGDLARRNRADVSRISRQRGHFPYFTPGAVNLSNSVAPPVADRSFRIETSFRVPAQGLEGVIVSHGGLPGGYALYVLNNRLAFSYNYLMEEWYDIEAETRLPTGDVDVVFSFTKTGPFAGRGELSVNGQVVARGEISRTIRHRLPLNETFDVGRDGGTAVTPKYRSPFPFTGMLERVDFHLQDQ